jgi:hypothetical protein
MRRRGESNFRIEIFTNLRGGQKDEFEKLLPELAPLTAPYIREYFYPPIGPVITHTRVGYSVNVGYLKIFTTLPIH